MRILILSDGIPPFVMGGMQKHTLNLCKFLVLAGHDVTLAHCVGHMDDIPSVTDVLEAIFNSNEVRPNFSEIGFNFPAPGKIPGHYVRASKTYSQNIFNEMKPVINTFDFIYAQGFVGDAFYKNSNEVQIGVNFHGLEMFQKQANLKSKLQGKLLKKTVNEHLNQADYVFSLGGKLSDIIESQGVETSRVIELANAVDDSWVNRELFIEDEINELKFLFVGRYERRKGVEELSNAIQTFLETNKLVSFDFVGPIPMEKRIQNDRVNYYGKVMDSGRLKSIYRDNHILICPSYAEGMPTVILEAMSQGLAVIGTDVGATRLLVNENTGWLLENSSSEEILAKMEVAFSEKDNLHQKRKTAKTHVLNSFTWDQVIKKTEAFFERAIEK